MSQPRPELSSRWEDVKGLIERLPLAVPGFLGAYLTGSRVWHFAERMPGEYGHRKRPRRESDWDILVHTRFPVVNLRSLAAGLHVDLSARTELPENRTLIPLTPDVPEPTDHLEMLV